MPVRAKAVYQSKPIFSKTVYPEMYLLPIIMECFRVIQSNGRTRPKSLCNTQQAPVK